MAKQPNPWNWHPTPVKFPGEVICGFCYRYVTMKKVLRQVDGHPVTMLQCPICGNEEKVEASQ